MFNGIWLVASEPLTIKGREVSAGEQFEISRHKSGELIVLGRATIAKSQSAPPQPPPQPEPPPPPPPEPEPAAEIESVTPIYHNFDTGLDVTITPDEPTKPTRRRRYVRRDLEAEP